MWGIFISTLGLFSTCEGFHECIREPSHEYIDGYHDSYQRMDTLSTLGVLGTLRGYHEYIKVFSTWKDIVSTLQDVQYIGGIS